MTSPATPGLTNDLIAQLLQRLALAATDPDWLCAGIACDIPLHAMSHQAALAVLNEARSALGDEPVDINLVPVADRRKKLFIADMDSTMIHQECIDELGSAAGAGEHIKEVTRRAMRGEIDFVQALEDRVAFMRGLDESIIRKVIDEHITFVPGGRTAVSTMKAAGAHCALISGGFTQFTEHVATKCGFNEHQANRLVIADGKLCGTVEKPALGSAAKVDALNRLSRQRGITLNDAMTVGDGANDIAMIEAAGMGVAMHAKPAVRAAARFVIDHADLTGLLYLQGYRATEFKT